MGTSKIIYRMSQFPNGLRRRRWRRDRGAAGTRRPGHRPGRTRREGAAAGSSPARLGSTRHGPVRARMAGGSGGAEGRRQPRASVLPSPRDGRAATAAGRVLRGDARPSPTLAFCLASPRGWGSPGPRRNRPVRGAPKQQGQSPRPGPQAPGAERPGLGDGSSSAPGRSEAPKERPDFHRVPHPALLNKTRCSKTHK